MGQVAEIFTSAIQRSQTRPNYPFTFINDHARQEWHRVDKAAIAKLSELSDTSGDEARRDYTILRRRHNQFTLATQFATAFESFGGHFGSNAHMTDRIARQAFENVCGQAFSANALISIREHIGDMWAHTPALDSLYVPQTFAASITPAHLEPKFTLRPDGQAIWSNWVDIVAEDEPAILFQLAYMARFAQMVESRVARGTSPDVASAIQRTLYELQTEPRLSPVMREDRLACLEACWVHSDVLRPCLEAHRQTRLVAESASCSTPALDLKIET